MEINGVLKPSSQALEGMQRIASIAVPLETRIQCAVCLFFNYLQAIYLLCFWFSLM